VLPARGGDLLRVEYLARRTGKSRATILGTEVVDRWLDWWGWFPVLAAVAIAGGLPHWLETAFGTVALALVAWGLVMVALCRRGHEPKPGSRLGAAYRALQVGLQSFRTRRTLLVALFVAPIPWLWETFALVVAAHAFGIHLTFSSAFCVLVGFNFAMLIPSPGGVGSVEAGGTAALTFCGVDQSTALAFMLVYHFTQLLPAVAMGAAILVGEPRLRRNAPQEQPKRDIAPGVTDGASAR
jgi:uncharacterized membrane protein YbhN (UPF0104 family)